MSDIIERANHGKAKLWEIAEDWQKSRGLPVPEKRTPAYEIMYEAWVNHAFGA